jgi:metallo-beta-lactamase class B
MDGLGVLLPALRCLLAGAVFSSAFSPRLAAQTPPLPPPPGLEASRRLFDSWKAPVPPRRLVGNVHYVGAAGVSSFLITSPAGHILLDTGFEETVPIILRSVAQLGFRADDIKFILSSHAHVDHTGGHARMQQLTGATIVASAEDARLLADGGTKDHSPFPIELMRYTPAKAGRIVRNGDTITLGGVTLTAHLTPGHTRGATTWAMRVKEGDRTCDVVFFSSTSIVAGTRLLYPPAYPTIVADYKATWAKLKSLPCDIWFSPHGGQFSMAQKIDQLDRGSQPNPFIDPAGWKSLLEKSEREFNAQLDAERAATSR